LLPISTEVSKELSTGQPELGDELPLPNEFQVASPTLPVKKILVIDDEETVLDLWAQLIRLNGWEAITACGGEEGLRIATQSADELSCVLVDVVMPEMGANELLRELEERGIELPVVVMSGFSQTKLEFFLDRPNVLAIVEKPFRAQQLKQAVQDAIEFGEGNGFGP
jgi:FixJ family two-component response regulator